MRYPRKSLRVSLIASLVLVLSAPAYANGTGRHHARTLHAHVYIKGPVTTYYGYPAGYAYYVPTHVFRCYPARARVRDQVGFTAGYVPLGACG